MLACCKRLVHGEEGDSNGMCCRYICYLYWQLKTHKDMFTGEEGGDEEHPVLSIVAAFGALAVITIIVAVCSE